MPYCPKCGSQVSGESRFCPNCGNDLKAPSTSSQAQYQREPVKQRPTGIAILAILQVLGGIIFSVAGILLMILSGFISIAGVERNGSVFPILFGGVVLGIIGVIALIIGIVSFAVAYGYWNGLGWSWTLGLVITVIGLIIGLLSLPSGIVDIVIIGLILYYLTRPHVKKWFGKKPITVTV